MTVAVRFVGHPALHSSVLPTNQLRTALTFDFNSILRCIATTVSDVPNLSELERQGREDRSHIPRHVHQFSGSNEFVLTKQNLGQQVINAALDQDAMVWLEPHERIDRFQGVPWIPVQAVKTCAVKRMFQTQDQFRNISLALRENKHRMALSRYQMHGRDCR